LDKGKKSESKRNPILVDAKWIICPDYSANII
jgi:hypothetical protein